MLRALVWLLVLANLLFFAWTQGWIDGVEGARATGQREPGRLDQQVRPEVVKILPPQPVKSAGAPAAAVVAVASPASEAAPDAAPSPPPAAAAAPFVCLEAGPFVGAEASAAESALRAALPAGGWVSVRQGKPGLWMVYLGKFRDREELLKRQEDLRARRIEYDELRSPPEWAPGLSLGRFEERGNAVNAMEKFAQRGIRGARVIEVRSPVTSVTLRFEKASPAEAAQLTAISSAALGKGFVPCARSAGN